jgi:glycosyltransferase involved in cell wall biosynthesis
MRLSVLMSVYEGERPDTLALCLESMAGQTLPADEVILVEDGPLPYSLQRVIEQYSGSLRMVSVKLNRRRGLGNALARGLQECSGALVARMDADDICVADRFAKQVAYLEGNTDIDIVGGYGIEIDSRGAKGEIRTVPLSHGDIVKELWRCPLIHPTIMFRKDSVLSVGSYNRDLERRQDYELWFRCASRGLMFANIGSVLIYYRFSQATLRRQSARLAFRQGLIGFRGSSALGLAFWKRCACFVPFLRSLLPVATQHYVYTALRRRAHGR